MSGEIVVVTISEGARILRRDREVLQKWVTEARRCGYLRRAFVENGWRYYRLEDLRRLSREHSRKAPSLTRAETMRRLGTGGAAMRPTREERGV